MESSAGYRLRRALDLQFSLEAGFTVTLGDVTAEEFHDLRVVREERDRYLREERERIRG